MRKMCHNLQLKVTGNNLSGVCKLIFKVAKNDKNDYLFLQKNVLGKGHSKYYEHNILPFQNFSLMRSDAPVP